VRLLLDEHYSPRIAERLREQGHDVTAVAASDKAGLADRPLLNAAREEGRALVTENVYDFIPITVELTHLEAHHPGIIFTNRHRFSRSRDGIGRLVDALDAILVAHPGDDALADRVVWLDAPATPVA
jgi:hypothetical protein